MKNLTFGLECTTSKKCNIHIFKTMSSNISVYNQKKCVLCCDNFKSDVIILPCKHIFDLKCLMTYVKFNYLEKKSGGGNPLPNRDRVNIMHSVYVLSDLPYHLFFVQDFPQKFPIEVRQRV